MQSSKSTEGTYISISVPEDSSKRRVVKLEEVPLLFNELNYHSAPAQNNIWGVLVKWG